MFVVVFADAIGGHIVEAYSSIGLHCSYVENNVSLCLSHFVEERTLSVGIVSPVLVLKRPIDIALNFITIINTIFISML